MRHWWWGTKACQPHYFFRKKCAFLSEEIMMRLLLGGTPACLIVSSEKKMFIVSCGNSTALAAGPSMTAAGLFAIWFFGGPGWSSSCSSAASQHALRLGHSSLLILQTWQSQQPQDSLTGWWTFRHCRGAGKIAENMKVEQQWTATDRSALITTFATRLKEELLLSLISILFYPTTDVQHYYKDKRMLELLVGCPQKRSAASSTADAGRV